MIRTQIFLEEEAYKAAKAEAKRAGISLSEFLRRCVVISLARSSSRRQRWLSYAGALGSGDRNASRTVDGVVYGRPRS